MVGVAAAIITTRYVNIAWGCFYGAVFVLVFGNSLLLFLARPGGSRQVELKKVMCYLRGGYKYRDIKTTWRWRGEQHKRQRCFAFRKMLGFVLWGIKKEPSEKDS
ncbi:hypothetical protein VQ01_11300 [Tamlana sp. s12]|nr:hypothetical protein VQ01_11300 [Tamlana sp. s12]